MRALLLALALSASAGPAWQPWGEPLFARARAENKLVLLDLEAVWCHWCHVQDQTTYRDPAVLAELGRHFLVSKVDQDADPALAARYQRYGWPATIVLTAEGAEVARVRGYLEPERMLRLLRASVADPSPAPDDAADAPAPAPAGALPEAVRAELRRRDREAYDPEFGGWGRHHKLVDADALELALELAREGDAEHQRMARQTLTAARALLDPVWGGVCQYSDRLDWRGPHFERIMSYQAAALRAWSRAAAQLGDPADLAAARGVAGYLAGFLTSPEGAFYASQDADLSARVDGHAYYALPEAERRRRGLPRVDTHLYARENGWAIRGLLALYDATGDAELLARAEKAARWVLAHRALEGGGFAHGESASQPALADTLAMAQALYALHQSTGEPAWLERALEAARFITRTFADPRGGYASGPVAGPLRGAHRDAQQNAELARLLAALARASGDAALRAAAERALAYAASPAVLGDRGLFDEVLLADRALSREPPHVTVVAPRGDPAGRALWLAARRFPASDLRTTWYDRREPQPPGGLTFPALARPAAFVCGERTCSLPLTTPEAVREALERGARP